MHAVFFPQGPSLHTKVAPRARNLPLHRSLRERRPSRPSRVRDVFGQHALSEVGDAAGARVAFERGIAAGSTIAALNLGLMLADMGEVDDALRYLRIARDQHGDVEAHWAIGKLLEGKGDRMAAIESYQTGAAAGHAPAAFALGVVMHDLGEGDGAKGASKRASELGDDRVKLPSPANQTAQRPASARAECEAVFALTQASSLVNANSPPVASRQDAREA
jgi:tetratricopeptide (TPR) repeat protein